MTKHLTRPFRSRRARALTALATLALSASALTGTATASPGSGEVVLSLKSAIENSLPQQGVRVSYGAKAGKTGASKRATRPQSKKAGAAQTVALPVVDVEMREAATVRTSGVLAFSLKGEKALLTDVTLQIGKGTTAISAKLDDRRLIFFRAKGQPQIDGSSVKLESAGLSLTSKGARALRAQLDLETLAVGRVGTADVDAQLTLAAPVPASAPAQPGIPTPVTPTPTPPDPLVDPYAERCSLGVTSRVDGAAAGPAPAPVLSSPTTVSGGAIDWGFQSSFRFYVVTISGGTIVPIAPASAPNQPAEGFSFPAGGEYAFNAAADSGDDQATIDGSGEVVLCNAPHGFRIVLSNPTVTIDGADSRLTVDVDTNMSGLHTPTQRVDLATLDSEDATPFYDENAKSVTWSDLPVALTQAGSEALALCGPGAPGPCDYEAGDELEPLSVTANTEAEVAWPFNASCDLSAVNPMPSPTTTDSWPPIPAAPAALPSLTSPQAITDGSVSWGVRNSLRGTINATGQFNLSGGATRSDPTSMSGAGKFFTWPASSGQYEAGTGDEPGRLVLRATGTVGLCQVHPAQAYGTVLSNPTLVIDGANSHLTMDVSSRFRFSWTSGRVDVASLAIGNVVVEKLADTPSVGQETIRWTFPDLGADNALSGGDDDTDSVNTSVKLAGGGASGLWLLGSGSPTSPYKTVGTPLNKIAVSIVRPSS
jgi:hypothetical protein